MATVTLCQWADGAPLRRLPGQVCDQCRRRKTRCDRLPVCTSCTRSGTLCSYDEKPRRRGPRPRKKSGDGSGRSTTQGRGDRGYSGENTSPPRQLQDHFSSPSDPQTPSEPGTTSVPYRGPPEPIRVDAAAPQSDSRRRPMSPSSTASSPDSGASSSVAPEASHVSTTAATDLPSDDGCHPVNTALLEPQTRSFDGAEPCTLTWVDDLDFVTADQEVPRSVLLAYLEIFLQRLYPVFPVLDRHAIRAALQTPYPISPSMYGFLTALAAAVIVQLNVDGSLFELDSQAALNPEMVRLSGLPYSAHFLATESLRVRRGCDFIECADEYTILSSFFLFAYYGNLEQSRSAWYYLREAISFTLSLGFDEPETYLGLDTETQQRRKRLYWLLFVTERAYAVQHRRKVMLRPCIELPRVFESDDPRLIYGFVTLVKVFAAVDDEFLSAWRNDQLSSSHENINGTHDAARPSLSRLLSYNDEDDGPGALPMSEMDETQRLDILVTRQWLRALVWRLRLRVHTSVSRGTSSNKNTPDNEDHQPLQQKVTTSHHHHHYPHHPLQTARSVLSIISAANRVSLEAHGIGMEQKVYDIAHSLSDTLQHQHLSLQQASVSPGPGAELFFSGRDVLHHLVTFLASFRNHESRYLRPLLRDAAPLLSLGVGPGGLGLGMQMMMMPVDMDNSIVGMEAALFGDYGTCNSGEGPVQMEGDDGNGSGLVGVGGAVYGVGRNSPMGCR